MGSLLPMGLMPTNVPRLCSPADNAGSGVCSGNGPRTAGPTGTGPDAPEGRAPSPPRKPPTRGGCKETIGDAEKRPPAQNSLTGTPVGPGGRSESESQPGPDDRGPAHVVRHVRHSNSCTTAGRRQGNWPRNTGPPPDSEINTGPPPDSETPGRRRTRKASVSQSRPRQAGPWVAPHARRPGRAGGRRRLGHRRTADAGGPARPPARSWPGRADSGWPGCAGPVAPGPAAGGRRPPSSHGD
jgi:hypothetical protein